MRKTPQPVILLAAHALLNRWRWLRCQSDIGRIQSFGSCGRSSAMRQMGGLYEVTFSLSSKAVALNEASRHQELCRFGKAWRALDRHYS